MFDKATKKLVQQIDPSGVLIAVSSRNHSEKLQPLMVVLKSQKRWFWQQSKYSPTSFNLDDLLKGDKIKPVCKEEEFVKYVGTYRSSMFASVEMGAAAVTLNAKGQSTSNLSLSLGTLKKEYVDIPKLLNDSRGRMLDLTHPFIQQTMKRNETFTLIKERIFASTDCIIFYSEKENYGCHFVFGDLFNEKFMEGETKYGSETGYSVPPNTVFAYSVIEMNIESDGYFELCLTPSGLEADDTSQNPCPMYSEVDGQPPVIQKGLPLNTLKEALADSQLSFCALADVSADRRSSILLRLRNVLIDRSVLSALMDRFEASSSGENETIDELLDLLKSESPENCATAASHQKGCPTKSSKQSGELTDAMKMLISALEELTDTGLNLLEQFCTSEGLQNLQELVIQLTSNSVILWKDTISAFLQNDDEFHRVEELFKSCNVLLKKEKDTLTSEITCGEGFLPVVLCIAVHGLASLAAA